MSLFYALKPFSHYKIFWFSGFIPLTRPSSYASSPEKHVEPGGRIHFDFAPFLDSRKHTLIVSTPIVKGRRKHLLRVCYGQERREREGMISITTDWYNLLFNFLSLVPGSFWRSSRQVIAVTCIFFCKANKMTTMMTPLDMLSTEAKYQLYLYLIQT